MVTITKATVTIALPFVAMLIGAVLGVLYNGTEGWLLLPIITLMAVCVLSQTKYRLFGIPLDKALFIGLGCAMFMLGLYYHDALVGWIH